MEARDKTVAQWLKEAENEDKVSYAYKTLLDKYYSENVHLKPGGADNSKKEIQPSEEENTSKTKKVDVAIIVAVPNEKDGVYSAFGLPKGLKRQLDLLDKYHFDYVLFEHEGLNIALLIQTGMGMTQSSSLTTRAILGLQPKLVAMVGICAGRKDKTQLGDIIVASNVFDYTAGKQYVDRFGPRPRSYPLDDSLASYIVSSVLGDHELTGKIVDGYQGEKPKNSVEIQYKPLASGTAVVDDPQVLEEIIKTQDDLAGIDMEAYALAVSANILRTKWIVIKTVQDFADGEKTTTENGIRSFAAYSSAKLLELILSDLAQYV